MISKCLLCAAAGAAIWVGVASAVESAVGEPPLEALATKGSYNGYFYGARMFDGAEAPALRGTVSVKVTDVARGKLTVHAVLPDGPLNFNATAWTDEDTNGTKRVVLSGKGRNKAQLTLSVNEGRIWGTLEGGTLEEPLAIDGARNAFDGTGGTNATQARASVEALMGYYTVALPVASAVSTGKAEAAPQGVGYLTVMVGNRGVAKIAGKLADGTSVSLTAPLICFPGAAAVTNDVASTNEAEVVSADAVCVPVFKALSGKRGWLGGLLWLRAGETTLVETDRDLGWYLRWEYTGQKSNGNSKNAKDGADGFEMLLDACGGYYSSAAMVASNCLFSAGEPVGVTYTSGNSTGSYVADAIPAAIEVSGPANALKMGKGMQPVLVDGAYDYSGTNSAMATISSVSNKGIFKGSFKVYFDYERNGKLVHYQNTVQYVGVLAPTRGEVFADYPLGMGAYLIRDNAPAYRSYNLKRSFPVVLEGAEEEEPVE